MKPRYLILIISVLALLAGVGLHLGWGQQTAGDQGAQNFPQQQLAPFDTNLSDWTNYNPYQTNIAPSGANQFNYFTNDWYRGNNSLSNW